MTNLWNPCVVSVSSCEPSLAFHWCHAFWNKLGNDASRMSTNAQHKCFSLGTYWPFLSSYRDIHVYIHISRVLPFSVVSLRALGGAGRRATLIFVRLPTWGLPLLTYREASTFHVCIVRIYAFMCVLPIPFVFPLCSLVGLSAYSLMRGHHRMLFWQQTLLQRKAYNLRNHIQWNRTTSLVIWIFVCSTCVLWSQWTALRPLMHSNGHMQKCLALIHQHSS